MRIRPLFLLLALGACRAHGIPFASGRDSAAGRRS